MQAASWLPSFQASHRDRVVMPMNTGVPILRRQIARITSAASPHAWIATRLYVASAGTPRGAADWMLLSICVDGREKLQEPISGAIFAVGEMWSDVGWKLRAGRRVVIDVEYVGRRRRGCPFYAAIVGQRVRPKRIQKRRDRQVGRARRVGRARSRT